MILKLECKQTDIIREFELVDNPDEWILDNSQYYQEKKITKDKLGNIVNEKIMKPVTKYSYDKYIFRLKQQGYIEL